MQAFSLIFLFLSKYTALSLFAKETVSLSLPQGKRIYFASDFHLGAPDLASSRAREQKLLSWLDHASQDAAAIWLLGDLFDFWFEYRHAVPRGYVRFLGKLAELHDRGIDIRVFTGNHDMWMFGYLPDEIGIKVYKDPITLQLNKLKILIGHGDGLGPGDAKYKVLKKIFRSPLCQWAFARLHPNLGFAIANAWSRSSRKSSGIAHEQVFKGEGEWLWQYCKEVETQEHFDYYLFGHRHLALDLPIHDTARYLNTGEWFKGCHYVVSDGNKLTLHAWA
jgi:UDP-2,3-diacylglucosamine hydrolase